MLHGEKESEVLTKIRSRFRVRTKKQFEISDVGAAALLHCSPSHVSNILNGNLNLGFEWRVASFYDLSDIPPKGEGFRPAY